MSQSNSNSNANNSNSSKSQMSPSEVSKELRNTDTARILSRPDNDMEAKALNQAKASEQVLQQHQAAKEAAKVQKLVDDQPIRRTPQERALDKVTANLEIYKTSKIGSNEKMIALQRVVEVVQQHPKKNILDAILAFFKENRKATFLDEAHAMQNIAILSPSIRLRVEVLYHVMYSLANGQATKRTIDLNQLRTIFSSDDVVNWIAIKLRNAQSQRR